MPLPVLVDSHCHLDFPDFQDEIPQVLARARAAGVARMVTICTRLRSLGPVQALAEREAAVFFAAGTHPMNVAEEPLVRIEELEMLARHPKMVGIGETGLDYHYTAETARAQQQSLAVHIEAARRTALPLVIHARDADADIGRILAAEHTAGPFTCVMHCFTAGAALAEAALALGFYLSVSGIATFRSAGPLRAVFAAAPVERILVETDSPYLAPLPYRGRRNEPAFVAETARAVSGLWDMQPEAFAAQTTANFDRLFVKAACWTPA